jgi:hypothetical protein
MSTTKRVFAKLSAQEPMKVEFGTQEDLRDFIVKLDSSVSSLTRLATITNQKINEYNSIAKELENAASLADNFYSETLQTVRNSESYLKNLLSKLNELGMSFNDFPNASALDKKLDDMGKVLDGFTAIKNVNPRTIDKKV